MLHEIFSLFFPRLCLGCGCPLNDCEEFLCEHCKFDLPFTNYHSVRDNPVEQCFWGKVSVERATSLLYYYKKGIVSAFPVWADQPNRRKDRDDTEQFRRMVYGTYP